MEQVQLGKLSTNKASGKDVKRPDLDRALAFVREGETLVVHRIDWLARTLDDRCCLVQMLTKHGRSVSFVKGS